MVTIYNKTGVAVSDIDTSHAGVSYSADLSGANLGTFEVSFYSANVVTIPAHSYINPYNSDDPTDWYYLLDAVAPTDTSKGYYYALTFEHFSKLFQQIEFYYEDATGAKQYSWTLSAKLDTATGLILSAIQREFPTFGVTLGGYLSGTESKDFEFDGLNVYEAATYIAETFETELWFYGSEMHFEEAIFGKSLPHELTHTVNIEDAITAEYDDVRPQYVRALGGLTNMPVTTEGAIAYQGRLPMPEGKEVIEIEGVETGVTLNLKLDDYFPSMGGEITEVEYNDDDENPIYYVKTDLGYTLDSVKIDNGTARVMYFTGGISAQLTGREFDVEDYGDDQIQIFRTEDSGKFIPRPYIAPAVGDTFLLKNVTVNSEEIAEAQEELEAYVDDYVETLKTKSPNITLTTASVYYVNNPHTFLIGESVKVTHPSILGGSTTSRVIGVSIADWAEPSKVALTIQDEISAGRVSTLESDLQDLTANVNSTTTNSNGTYDTRYIRKDKDDNVAGNLVFDQGIRSNNFDASIRSGFNLFKDENGRGILQLNKIEAEELQVDIYTYNKIQAVGGSIVVSRAWAEVSRIEVSDDENPEYTFYYVPSDGLQLWKQGHQPRMAAGGRYFWGVITEVSENTNAAREHWFTCNNLAEYYIGDPAEVAVGDTFVLYGSRGSDLSDRGVTIIDSGFSDNPYPTISQYFNIDSFDLSNVSDKTSVKLSYNTAIGVEGAQILTDVANNALYFLGDNIYFLPSGSDTPLALAPTIVSNIDSLSAINSNSVFSINEKLVTRIEWEQISGRADVDHTPSEAGSTGSYMIALTSANSAGIDTTDLTAAYQALLDLFANDNILVLYDGYIVLEDDEYAVIRDGAGLDLYVDENTAFTRSDLSEALSAYYNAEKAIDASYVYSSVNLLDGTSSELKSATFSGWNYEIFYTEPYIVGDVFTARAWLNPQTVDTSIMIGIRYTDGTFTEGNGNIIAAMDSGYSQVTFTTIRDYSEVSNFSVRIRHQSNTPITDTCYYKELMLIKGNKIDGSWSPSVNDQATNLGYDSWDDMIAKAKEGNTIISGGYINTELIEAETISADKINVTDLIVQKLASGEYYSMALDGVWINSFSANNSMILQATLYDPVYNSITVGDFYDSIKGSGIECRQYTPISSNSYTIHADSYVMPSAISVWRRETSEYGYMTCGGYSCSIGARDDTDNSVYGFFSYVGSNSISYGANRGYYTNSMGKGNVLAGVFAMIDVASDGTLNDSWTRLGGSISCSRTNTGVYSVAFAFGNTDYTALAIANNIVNRVSLWSKSSTSCEFRTTNDGNTNGAFTAFFIDLDLY